MIKIEVENKSIEALMQLAKNIDPKDQGKAVYKGFKDAALLVERKLKDNITGRLLNVRSGHLRSSIGSLIETTDDGIKANIGSGARQGDRVKYANIHENGGTIRPRISQFLTIPLDAAKTPSGVTRFTAREVKEGGTSYQSSFVKKGIIFGVLQRKGGKNSIVPLFILKKSVEIPASHYMSITAQEMSQEVNVTILEGIRNDLNKGTTK